MAAPTIPVITSPGSVTKHFYGSNDSIAVICTIQNVEQVLIVYIGGVAEAYMYSPSGTSVTIPLVQLTNGSNVLTVKAMNFASELSAASDSVTVTGVDTRVTGDVDIESYISENFLAWARANSTITDLLAGAESVFYKNQKEVIYPALILAEINDDSEPMAAARSRVTVTFTVTAATKDLFSMEQGAFANPDLSGSRKGASYIANEIRKEIFDNYPSFMGNLIDLKQTGKTEGENDDQIMEYTMNFQAIYIKPKGRYE